MNSPTWLACPPQNTNAKRETGRTAQLANIQAAKAVSEIIRTTLGPRSMLKMLPFAVAACPSLPPPRLAPEATTAKVARAAR